MSDLYVMIGIPGAGKSTFIKKYVKNNNKYICVSRDKIRFNLLKENDEYFSKEDIVFKEFYAQINENLSLGFDVFADATHLTRKSRKKLLNKIKYADNIYAIFIDTPLSVALTMNALRTGRERVPDNIIQRMYASLEEPMLEEGFKDRVIIRNEGMY